MGWGIVWRYRDWVDVLGCCVLVHWISPVLAVDRFWGELARSGGLACGLWGAGVPVAGGLGWRGGRGRLTLFGLVDLFYALARA